MYGDGWDGARLFVEFPDLSQQSDAPTCDDNPIYHQICTDSSGRYILVNQLENDTEAVVPKDFWEVFWTTSYQTGEFCNETVLYTGGYNTSMVWYYNATNDLWSLVYSDNIWPNEQECDACGDAKACKPKPKPKPKKKKNDKGKIKKGGKDKDDDEIPSNSTSNSTEIEGPRYGPPAVNVRVTMFDEEGNGWFHSNYTGAHWYISDDTQTELFFTGTLCDGYSGYCRLCLGDGSYVFRVTGEYDNFTSWDFCGVTGDYSQTLHFHIKKGKCIPDSLTTLVQDCYAIVNSTVTVVGVVALNGIPSELFAESNNEVIIDTLGMEVQGWDIPNIQIVSSTLDSRVLAAGSRALSSFTHDVTFTVSFTSEVTYGVNGRDYSAVEELVEEIAYKLNSKMQTGEFLKEMVSNAKALNVPVMASVQGVELVSLDISSITYEGALPFTYSTLNLNSDDASASSSSGVNFDVTSIVIFFSALAFGFVAFVGVMSKGITGYKAVTQDSQHGAFPVPEVMPSEMDQSMASPKFAKFDISGVEASI